MLLHYLSKIKRSIKQLYISHVRQHLFREFLFAYVLFLQNTDIFVTLL